MLLAPLESKYVIAAQHRCYGDSNPLADPHDIEDDYEMDFVGYSAARLDNDYAGLALCRAEQALADYVQVMAIVMTMPLLFNQVYWRDSLCV